MAGVIEAHDVTKTFGEVTALNGIELSVPDGEIHGLLGPNGAGKSTLMRILLGLVRPDAGSISLFGRTHEGDGSVAALSGVAGFVDRPHFYPYLTARKTLELLAALDGGCPREVIDETLVITRLHDVAGRRIGGWSTGMVQRLGIAAALIRRPRLLLLDEPTEGLDPNGARDVIGLVRALAAEGVTVLFSSHDMSEVDEVCDAATILCRGQVVARGTIDELRARAPAGRHRLVTSDDEAALVVAGLHPVEVERPPRGALIVQAAPDALHGFICDLGRRDISVVMMEQELAPLTALFHQLTDAPHSLVAVS